MVSLGLLLLAACGQSAAPAPPPPPKVTVTRPVEREVVEWDEYTARLEATETVEVRARVSGYLEEVKFTDGATVKKGDVLFVIDPRPYVAVLRRAEAELALAKARLDLADKRFERASKLVARNAISQEEADTRAAEARQAEASVQAAAAALEAARLDVEYTQVHAPIGGRVSRKLVTEGNLVNGGSGTNGTLLTTIVSLDPLYVYFEADERAYLKYVKLAQEGKRPSSRDSRNPVQVGFADEQGFPHQGYMDFVDNHLDAGTGTIVGRAVLPNPELLYSPGLFARLRLIGSGDYRALLIPDQALLSDQSQKFVYVVGEDNKAVYRVVTIGPLIDGLRVVHSGLTPQDRVVIGGVQRVHAGGLVDPQEVPPPTAPPATPTSAPAPTPSLAGNGRRP
ncbi:MAG: efflux RND transporter periplasmic adaptor subunit [Deltaproteobacteria bacterium]|nr:efflux RND transporter periplasmic adaptor subunit [Deltaproteobacteria bacterium]